MNTVVDHWVRVTRLAPWLIAVLMAAIATPTVARAADTVTYEVTSDSVATAGVEFVQQSGRMLLTSVALPWRLSVTVDDAHGSAARGAQVRADWRAVAAPSHWVTVRILYAGKLLCQSTLDVGNATCYGDTPHVS